MKILKHLVLTGLLAASIFAAGNPFIGKWKLNPEKSTFIPGEAIKEMTICFSAEGDKVRRIAAGTHENGKPVEQGGPQGDAFRWDGTQHVAHEASPRVILSCTPVRNNATHVTVETNGKLSAKILAQVSPDGRTLTETTDNYDLAGNKSRSVLVFERQ